MDDIDYSIAVHDVSIMYSKENIPSDERKWIKKNLEKLVTEIKKLIPKKDAEVTIIIGTKRHKIGVGRPYRMTIVLSTDEEKCNFVWEKRPPYDITLGILKQIGKGIKAIWKDIVRILVSVGGGAGRAIGHAPKAAIMGP